MEGREGRDSAIVQEIREQVMLNNESLDYLEGRICEFLGLEVDFGNSLHRKEQLTSFKENLTQSQQKEIQLSMQTELEAEYEINRHVGLESDNEVQIVLEQKIKENKKLNIENRYVKRIQKGFFHVWFRGSNRYNVFYEERDYIGFLERCRISAEKNKTAITAFVLMNNHVHLQVYTHTLNDFMKSLLISFSQWYNRRNELDGQVFKSPFSSSPIYSRSSLERNLIYIFTNPVRAGMCSNIAEYKWSSFHFSKSGYYNILENHIKVETAAVDYLFKSTNSILKKAEEFLTHYSLDNNCKSKKCKQIKLCKPNDSEVAMYLKLLLNGRNLRELSNKEFTRIIKILKYNQHASYRQISSLTHESYHYIRQKFSQ